MKVANSYASLVRGVSQQNPQDRLPGQHTEQVNMIPDPVAGLARRHGTRWLAEQPLAYGYSDMVADSASWRTFIYTDAGKEYALLYRTSTGTTAMPLLAYNLTDNQWLNVVADPDDDAVASRLFYGVSAITSAGKYAMIASKAQPVTATTSDKWGADANQSQAVVWVRGGAYSRKFRVTAKRKSDGSTVEFEHTTPASAYQGTLNTSGIPLYIPDPAGGAATDTESVWINADGSAALSWGGWAPGSLTVKRAGIAITNVWPATPSGAFEYSWNSGAAAPTLYFDPSRAGEVNYSVTYSHIKTAANPNYSNQVAAATNAYNSAVTNWIGNASAAIQPSAIAESLKTAAVTAGLTATRVDAALVIDDVVDLTVTDNGDNSLIKGTGAKVDINTNLTAYHIPGKIVKVQSRATDDALYFKAVAKDPLVTTLTNVTWEECAGVEYTLDLGIILGRAEGTNYYLATSAAFMNALTGEDNAPTYAVNPCGDTDSVPMPHMVDRIITVLSVFQDRLIVGSAGVIRVSKSGDYFNFFRSSLLTVLAEDAFEVSSRGREDDELRYPVLYDRDLVIFARDAQYAISGRTPLAATGANLAVISSHKGAAVVPPVAAGSFVFYAKQGEESFSIHQLQPGQVAESPEAYLVSAQLDRYLKANVIELLQIAKPAMLLARSTGSRNSVYAFNYIDSAGQGRVQDAWHRWDYRFPVVGMATSKDGVVLFSLVNNESGVFIVADLQPLTAGLSTDPYLDSRRNYSSLTSGTSLTPTTSNPYARVAFNDDTEWRFIGGAITEADNIITQFPEASVLKAGYLIEASVTLTNPFVKDRNDKSITSGVLTITVINLTLRDSGGCISTIEVPGQDNVIDRFNGRTLGNLDNLVGIEPITTGQVSIPILQDTRDYNLTIASRDWFPFTITSIDWVGQFFNSTRRV